MLNEDTATVAIVSIQLKTETVEYYVIRTQSYVCQSLSKESNETQSMRFTKQINLRELMNLKEAPFAPFLNRRQPVWLTVRYLYSKPLLKKNILTRKELAPYRSAFFPWSVYPFSEGSQNDCARLVVWPENVSIVLNIQLHNVLIHFSNIIRGFSEQ